MAQLYRMKALGIDPLDDSIILFYRGQSFHYLQQSLVDITNDAVVLTIVIWILIDVSSTIFSISTVLTTRRGYWETSPRRLPIRRDLREY
jgi:hypothetical protein